MGPDAMQLVMAALTFLAGAKGDLLDTMSTQDYWRAKQQVVSVEQLKREALPEAAVGDVTALVRDLKSDEYKVREEARKKLEAMGPGVAAALAPAAASKDPEVAQVAAGLIAKFSTAGHARDVRRLMAIRTLGERKEAGALEMVKGLEGSKEPFVATYAKRAAAQIEGGALPVVDSRNKIVADAWLLPRDAGMVLQGTRLGWDVLTAESIGEGMKNGPRMFMPQPNQMQPAEPTKEELTARATKAILAMAERVGDWRVDGMTVALSANFDGDTGWFVTVLHGEYDPAAVASLFKNMSNGEGGPQAAKIDGADALALDSGLLVMPSAETLVVVYADDPDERAQKAEAIVKALRAGKGELEPGSPLGKLLVQAQQGSVVWGASQGMEALKKEAMFAGVDAITLSATKGAKDLDFVIAATGGDGDKLKASKETMEAGLKSTIAAGQAELAAAGQLPIAATIQPMLDMLQSIKISVDGETGKMTGQVQPAVVGAMLQELGMVMVISEMSTDGAIPGEVAPEP